MLTTDPHLWKMYDPDAWRENPVESKHRKLLRSQRLGDEGRDLKPGPVERDRLNVSLRVYLQRLTSSGIIQATPNGHIVRSGQGSSVEIPILLVQIPEVVDEVPEMCNLVRPGRVKASC